MDPAPAPFVIRINGHLGTTLLSAFPALAPEHRGAHTGLLQRSALYGRPADIEALGLDLQQTSSPRTAVHQDQVTAARRHGHPVAGVRLAAGSEGAMTMTGAPVRDPRADHLITPEKVSAPAHRRPALAASGVRSMDHALLVKNDSHPGI